MKPYKTPKNFSLFFSKLSNKGLPLHKPFQLANKVLDAIHNITKIFDFKKKLIFVEYKI